MDTFSSSAKRRLKKIFSPLAAVFLAGAVGVAFNDKDDGTELTEQQKAENYLSQHGCDENALREFRKGHVPYCPEDAAQPEEIAAHIKEP